jgi:DNA-directed RNA polymerase omega subunit
MSITSVGNIYYVDQKKDCKFNLRWQEKALEKAGNAYLLIILTSKRVNQLKKGVRPLIKVREDEPLHLIALKEIAMGKIVPTNNQITHKRKEPTDKSAQSEDSHKARKTKVKKSKTDESLDEILYEEVAS